ncbi:MAG: hypothetical protein WC810_25280 [Janthinobacterium sp.]|jgi:hypothetical protein
MGLLKNQKRKRKINDMKNRFIIKKYIEASTVKEVLRLEPKAIISEVYLDKIPEYQEQVPAIGFTMDEESQASGSEARKNK